MNFLEELGIKPKNFGASSGRTWYETATEGELKISSPATGEHIASVYQASEADYRKVMDLAVQGFEYWRHTPAPKRGEVVRQLGGLAGRDVDRGDRNRRDRDRGPGLRPGHRGLGRPHHRGERESCQWAVGGELAALCDRGLWRAAGDQSSGSVGQVPPRPHSRPAIL